MKLPVPPPSQAELMNATFAHPESQRAFAELSVAGLGPAPEGQYRHWDTFRHAPPRSDHPAELQWLVVKIARQALYRRLALVDSKGVPFRFALPNVALHYLHRIDRDATGNIRGADQVTNPATRDTYLIRSLVEEAITSSQLEGASTTRQVAKSMLQEGREPRDRSERMIKNNFEAMRLLQELRERPLTPEVVFRLHRVLTEGTLDDPAAAGRFRRDDEPIVIEDDTTGTLLHLPPPAAQLPARLERLCAFANGEGDGEFIPPPVRAILLHFWLAYDHPFVDGNGRTARALFYWSMAREGYWLCEYVSISRILRKARGAYARSYLYSETDENDATYFLLHQLRVLCRAIDDLHEYLARKKAQLQETEALIKRARLARGVLNPRQLALMHHALQRPDALYTFESHAWSHRVSFQTARTDLQALAGLKLLRRGKRGRQFVFSPATELKKRLEEHLEQKS